MRSRKSADERGLCVEVDQDRDASSRMSLFPAFEGTVLLEIIVACVPPDETLWVDDSVRNRQMNMRHSDTNRPNRSTSSRRSVKCLNFIAILIEACSQTKVLSRRSAGPLLWDR